MTGEKETKQKLLQAYNTSGNQEVRVSLQSLNLELTHFPPSGKIQMCQNSGSLERTKNCCTFSYSKCLGSNKYPLGTIYQILMSLWSAIQINHQSRQTWVKLFLRKILIALISTVNKSDFIICTLLHRTGPGLPVLGLTGNDPEH